MELGIQSNNCTSPIHAKRHRRKLEMSEPRPNASHHDIIQAPSAAGGQYHIDQLKDEGTTRMKKRGAAFLNILGFMDWDDSVVSILCGNGGRHTQTHASRAAICTNSKYLHCEGRPNTRDVGCCNFMNLSKGNAIPFCIPWAKLAWQ